jgi:hypothetical protein
MEQAERIHVFDEPPQVLQQLNQAGNNGRDGRSLTLSYPDGPRR